MIAQAIQKISTGQHLTLDETDASMTEIMSGQVSDIQLAAFLVGLRVKGETAPEITGGARSLNRFARRIEPAVPFSLDIVGTGGDGSGTFNISSVAALVASAAGAVVAKHGNRAVSSQCGSADFFEALGLRLDLTGRQACQSLEELGFTFLFAQQYHPAMKVVSAVRRQLGVRTIFNLLGPLANPAGVSGMLLGVCDAGLLDYMAEALQLLGLTRAFVVHGLDHSDEISLAGPTEYRELDHGLIRKGTLCPESYGLARCRPADLRGGSPRENAALAEAILDGKPGAPLDAVLFNAGVALMVAGRAEDPGDGIRQARNAVVSGAARQKLESLRHFSSACQARPAEPAATAFPGTQARLAEPAATAFPGTQARLADEEAAS